MFNLVVMIVEWNARYIITCCLLFFGLAGAGQPDFRNPIVLNEDNGLPSNYLSDVLVDQQGFTWVSSVRGVCRFDGQEARLFQHVEDDSSSLANDKVDCLMLDSEGQLWVGTPDGVSIMAKGSETFHNIYGQANAPGKLPMGRVTALHEDTQGYVWIGVSGAGLARFSPCTGQFDLFPLKASGSVGSSVDTSRINGVLHIQPDYLEDTVLWLATLAGLVRFNTQNQQHELFAFVSEDKNVQHSFNSMRRVYPHSNGKVYLGTWAGAGEFDPHTRQFRRLDFPGTEGRRSFAHRMVIALLPRSSTELWITYNQGLALISLDTFRPLHLYNNEPNTGEIYGVSLVDEKGRVWAATDYGLFIYNPIRNQIASHYFPTKDDELYYISSGMAESLDERYLYLTVLQGEGLYIFDRKYRTWEIIRPKEAHYDGLGGFLGVRILRLRDGRLIVLSESGLFFFDEKKRRLRQIPVHFGVEAPVFRSVVEGESGELWVGSRRRGLFRVNLASGAVRHYEDVFNGQGIWIEELFRDSRGNIWIRTASGFGIYLTHRDSMLQFPYGLDEKAHQKSFISVRGFAEDHQGRIWIAGGEQGVGVVAPNRLEQGILRKYTEKDGLKCRNAQQLLSDQNGFLWINGDSGLVRFDPLRLEFERFGPGYGVPIKNTNQLYLLKNGEIAIGVRKGFCTLHPDKLRLNVDPPTPYLSHFKVFGREFGQFSGAGEVRLSYRQNFFSFEFSAIGYNLPEQHTFAYQLTGVDNDWVYAGRRRYASYTNIKGGSYQFRVKAANNEGVWSERPYTLNIFITTPWWQASWFWLLAGLALGLGVVGAVRWRIAQVKKKEFLKAEFDRKLANVELNALRAQMNPHFIFNCLNSIDYYILKNDTDKASDYLNRFSRLIRLILQNSRSEYVNLRDELEALKLYIEMESLRFEQQFDYEVKVSRGLNMDEVEIPPMLLQPYVENAIWHGLIQKEGKGRLDLIITKENGNLHCIIEDNGIGREAARQLRSKTATRRKSMGMDITQDRIGVINKLYNTGANIRIIDLKDEAGKALGTRVELNIPM